MDNNSCKQPTLFARVVMVLLLLSPILQCYGWGKFDFSFIIMSILAVCHLIIHGVKNTKVPRTFFWYFGWWYVSHLLSSTSVGEFLPMGLIRILLTYIMYIDLFDLDYFMSKYQKIAGLIIAYFYVQELGRIFLGTKLPSIIPFLPFAVTDDVQAFVQANIEAIRSSSLFKEPAVFAQYLLPLLCYEIFGKEKGRNWKYIIFLIATLLWSRAGNAMVGLLALAGCYGFYSLWFQKGAKKISYIILGGVFIIGSITIFLRTEGGQDVFERVITFDSESTIDKGYASSTFMRVYQGYYIFDEFSDFYKITGNDHDNYIRQQAFASPIMSFFYRETDFVTYFNSFQHVLIYTGYIGVLLIFLFFREIWKGNTYCGKAMLIVLFTISLISSNFFTPIMALYLLPAIALQKKEKQQIC